MSMLNTADYYRRREAQERRLAAQALSPDIRAIHEDLAERYLALVAEATPAPRPTLRLAISR